MLWRSTGSKQSEGGMNYIIAMRLSKTLNKCISDSIFVISMVSILTLKYTLNTKHNTHFQTLINAHYIFSSSSRSVYFQFCWIKKQFFVFAFSCFAINFEILKTLTLLFFSVFFFLLLLLALPLTLSGLTYTSSQKKKFIVEKNGKILSISFTHRIECVHIFSFNLIDAKVCAYNRAYGVQVRSCTFSRFIQKIWPEAIFRSRFGHIVIRSHQLCVYRSI